MKCSEVRRVLDLLAGGDLEPRESEALLEHLDSCPECKEEYESCLRTLQAVSSLGIASMGEEIPETRHPGFWTGLEGTVLNRLSRPSPVGIHSWAFFGAGFAAAAGLLFAIWLALPGSGGPGGVPGVRVKPSPVAGGPAGSRLVPVKGPLTPFTLPGLETQGGAVPVRWFRFDRPKRLERKGQVPAEAVPAGDRGRF